MQLLQRRPEEPEIRRELQLILASAAFRGSKRCQDFLRYVSLKSIAGESDTLKERTLAIEVFGRGTANDLGAADSIVRVGAREVRKRLAQYYVGDGAHDEVRIDLPPGAYVPVFHCSGKESDTNTAVLPTATLTIEEAKQVNTPPVRKRHLVEWTAGLLIAGLACALWISRTRATPFDIFWRPVLKASSPVVLVLPHPIVYHPSDRATDLDLKRRGGRRFPGQRAIDLPPELLNGSDFVSVLDQYVGVGDAVAALRLASRLEQHSIHPRFRLASRVEFSDLRDITPILIGAYTNRWTVELTKDLRFRFSRDYHAVGILDAANRHLWSLAKKADGRSAEDYVLICRLLRAETGGFLMIGAGVNMTGTEEAGRILSDPDSLEPILRLLPKGWATSNLELVLHVEVVGDTPVLPRLVAVQSWKP